jgi:hypothetical protein
MNVPFCKANSWLRLREKIESIDGLGKMNIFAGYHLELETVPAANYHGLMVGG